RVDGDAAELDLEFDREGRLLDGQVALEDEVLLVAGGTGGDEGHFGELLHVEEVLALDMAVAVRVVGVEGRRLHDGLDLGALDGVADHQGGVSVGEGAADLADARVADAESDLRVGLIELPGAGGECY